MIPPLTQNPALRERFVIYEKGTGDQIPVRKEEPRKEFAFFSIIIGRGGVLQENSRTNFLWKHIPPREKPPPLHIRLANQNLPKRTFLVRKTNAAMSRPF